MLVKGKHTRCTRTRVFISFFSDWWVEMGHCVNDVWIFVNAVTKCPLTGHGSNRLNFQQSKIFTDFPPKGSLKLLRISDICLEM